MKVVLAAINAKYSHTNLAVRSVGACLARKGIKAELVESTINNSARSILEELYGHKADIYIFSCYIWNIGLIERIAPDLKAVLPGAVLAAAGPQAGFCGESFLLDHPAFDFVLCGEGEDITPEFLACLEKCGDLGRCAGLVYRKGQGIVTTKPGDPVDMDSLPFAYDHLEDLKDRILYYESMRGCPFSCSYCLSSATEGVRVRSLALVCRDLRQLLDAGVRQVKFVDRTFNAVREHAVAIWRFLMEEDNGVTNFHFELSGELLDREMLDLLAEARPGLFQFEIGVQSANPAALREVGRRSGLTGLSQNVKSLRESGNIHLHLDLIAGLPEEDFDSFGESFDWVYSLEPDQLQLGFLKVLPGSEMERRAGGYGLVYSKTAPFEVLGTKWLDYGDLRRLHGVADMLELYYNSGRFRRILRYILHNFPERTGPFALFRRLWAFYSGNGHDRVPLSKIGYYDILEPFMRENGIPVTERAKWLSKMDLLEVEKPKKLPRWVDVDLSTGFYRRILDFLGRKEIIGCFLPACSGMDPKQVKRIVHVEIFPFSPDTGREAQCAVLYDYRSGRRWEFPVSPDGRIGSRPVSSRQKK